MPKNPTAPYPGRGRGGRTNERHATERRVRVELDRLVSRRAGRSTRSSDKREFEDRWIRAGIAKREQDWHVHATCLNRVRSEAHRCEKSLDDRRIYTEGSIKHPRKTRRPGTWDCRITKWQPTAKKFLTAKYGKVVTSRRHSMYQGAGKHSNNAGELTGALLRVVQGEMGAHGRTTFFVRQHIRDQHSHGQNDPSLRPRQQQLAVGYPAKGRVPTAPERARGREEHIDNG